MAIEYSSNMASLLLRVRNILAEEITSVGRLYGIKQVKRGILPNNATFPVISITPEYEQNRKVDSACLHIERGIKIFIITMSNKPEDIQKLQTYSNAAFEILRDNFQAKDKNGTPAAYHSNISDINFAADGLSADMTITYWGQQEWEPRIQANNISDTPDVTKIGKSIYDFLSSYKKTNLNSVAQIIYEDWGNNATRRFPTVLIEADEQVNINWNSGQDVFQIPFRIDLYSKIASASDNVIVSHLKTVDSIKKLLQVNANWNGECYDSQVEGVRHGTVALDEQGMMYSSSVTLTALVRNRKPTTSVS